MGRRSLRLSDVAVVFVFYGPRPISYRRNGDTAVGLTVDSPSVYHWILEMSEGPISISLVELKAAATR